MITIQTDADFTPAGKRTARIVSTRGQFGRGQQIRWYVSGKTYNRLPVNQANITLTSAWVVGRF